MTTFDWILIAVIGLTGWQGRRAGLIGGALSLAGFFGGALLAARLAPLLLEQGERSPYAPMIALIGAAVGGAGMAIVLERVGIKLRKALPLPFVGMFDRLLGGIFGLVVGVAVVWLGAVVVVQLPGLDSVRREIRASQVVSLIGGVAPPADQLLGWISAFDPLPAVSGLTPVLVGKPDPAILKSSAVRADRAGVVRIRAKACGFSVEGTGWVAGPGLVVTNAHVVAGDGSPSVEVGGSGLGLSSGVLTFNRHDDVAVIGVPGLSVPALRIGSDPKAGTTAVILGYPLDGAFTTSAARVGQTLLAITQDAYGRKKVRRTITILRGNVKPGNSGGPVIDQRGRVVGTVFARTNGGGPQGGFSIPPSVVSKELLRAKSGKRDPTGPCGR
ncbi:MAG: MarP family serine protease [Solirubrobacterales bacterium]|nr:MarP family serine protease [Solirubrobacterales bacterium]